jgi:predicted lipoprotein
MRLAPSATFIRIAECALRRRPERNATGVYLAILYTLLKMAKEGKIRSFTVFADAQGRPKVVVMK